MLVGEELLTCFGRAFTKLNWQWQVFVVVAVPQQQVCGDERQTALNACFNMFSIQNIIPLPTLAQI